MDHTQIVNRVYTLNSSLDFYLLFEHFTTYCTTIRFHTLHHHNSIFSSLHNFVMLKDICKWDLLHRHIMLVAEDAGDMRGKWTRVYCACSNCYAYTCSGRSFWNGFVEPTVNCTGLF